MRFSSKYYDRVMDWLANHVLPPPKPTGLVLFGYAVLWTDVGATVIAAAIPTALFLTDGNWWWFPAMALGMAFCAVLM